MNATKTIFDPLLYATSLPLSRTLFPLGFPATISTNCRHIVAAAETLAGQGGSPRGNRKPLPRAVELRLAVTESAAGAAPPPAALPRGQGHLLSFVHDAQNFAVCDLRAGFAFGWLTQAVAHDLPRVRYHFVEPIVMLMLQSWYFSVVHAACVSLDGRGVLLCGDSEAGKSTLAYGCAKRGWTYVCDDASHLLRDAEHRTIAGMCHQIRFRPSAAELFPELAAFTPFERPNGKPALELDAKALNIATSPEAHIDCLVFLKRDPHAREKMARFDKSEALERFEAVHCVGEESLRREQRDALRRLLTAPVYEMTYQDLDDAERRLRSLLETGDQS